MTLKYKEEKFRRLMALTLPISLGQSSGECSHD